MAKTVPVHKSRWANVPKVSEAELDKIRERHRQKIQGRVNLEMRSLMLMHNQKGGLALQLYSGLSKGTISRYRGLLNAKSKYYRKPARPLYSTVLALKGKGN